MFDDGKGASEEAPFYNPFNDTDVEMRFLMIAVITAAMGVYHSPTEPNTMRLLIQACQLLDREVEERRFGSKRRNN